VAAMVSSFGVSIYFMILKKQGVVIPVERALLITIGLTTICWVLTAYLGPQTDRQILIKFYRKVLPFGPGWRRIRREAGVSLEEAQATHENVPLALMGCLASSVVIWSSLFMVGSYLYGRMAQAFILFAVFIASGILLIYVMNRLWDTNSKSKAQQG
jgi:hypothetical protein